MKMTAARLLKQQLEDIIPGQTPDARRILRKAVSSVETTIVLRLIDETDRSVMRCTDGHSSMMIFHGDGTIVLNDDNLDYSHESISQDFMNNLALQLMKHKPCKIDKARNCATIEIEIIL